MEQYNLNYPRVLLAIIAEYLKPCGLKIARVKLLIINQLNKQNCLLCGSLFPSIAITRKNQTTNALLFGWYLCRLCHYNLVIFHNDFLLFEELIK